MAYTHITNNIFEKLEALLAGTDDQELRDFLTEGRADINMDRVSGPDLDTAKCYRFTVTGTLYVDSSHSELEAFDGAIRGFEDKAGNEFLPIFALEKNESTEPPLDSDRAQKRHGFEIVDYDITSFEEVEEVVDEEGIIRGTVPV